MAIIDNAATSPQTLAEWKASMLTMNRGELMAQQLVQRGAENALATLLEVGVTSSNCASMLNSLREGLFAIHEVAIERGIQLVSYVDQPNADRTPGQKGGA